jgi:hypothetical protein
MRLAAAKLIIKYNTLKHEGVKEIIRGFINAFQQVKTMPSDLKGFDIDKQWVKKHSGIEWRIVKKDYSQIRSVVDSYVYEYFNFGRMKHIVAEGYTGWVTDNKFYNKNTIENMAELYLHLRKDVYIPADPMIYNYYKTKNVNILIDNPGFLLLFTPLTYKDKYDPLIIKWGMGLDKTVVDYLEILA